MINYRQRPVRISSFSLQSAYRADSDDNTYLKRNNLRDLFYNHKDNGLCIQCTHIDGRQRNSQSRLHPERFYAWPCLIFFGADMKKTVRQFCVKWGTLSAYLKYTTLFRDIQYVGVCQD